MVHGQCLLVARHHHDVMMRLAHGPDTARGGSRSTGTDRRPVRRSRKKSMVSKSLIWIRPCAGRYSRPTGRYKKHAGVPCRPWPLTSTCWSSAPGSPASTSCTGPAKQGFSAQLLEAGGGVGGTWYWNRYPGARFDSESYTYGYLFSQELFDEWEWQEHFAGQPETERYLNHVVDRFDLRRHMRLRTKVTSAGLRRGSGRHGSVTHRRRRTSTEPGSSSPPPASSRCRYFPDVPGRGGLPRRVVPHRSVARRHRSTSPASGWRSSAPDRAASRSSPPSRTRSLR